MSNLVGSIVERTSSSSSTSTRAAPPTASPAARATGFPAVHHRAFGKSQFARSRDAQRSRGYDAERARAVPIVRSTKGASDRSSSPPSETTLGMGLGRGAAFTNVANDDKTSDNWRDEISEQNERVVASMTDEERRAQRREITERFGPDIGDVLRRVREQRLRQLQQQQQPPPPRKRNIDEVSGETSTSEREHSVEHVGGTSPSENGNISPQNPNESNSNERNESPTAASTSPPPHAPRPQRGILLTSASRANSPPPISRTSTPSTRKLRFAEVTPDDVHVYPSLPPSPRRTPILLLPPPSFQSLAGGSSDSSTSALDTAPTVKIQYKPPRIPKTKSSRAYSYDDSTDDDDASKPLRSHFRRHGSGAVDNDVRPEEGTPEDIRRRFFPHLPPRNPNLEWIEGPLRNQGSNPASVTGPGADVQSNSKGANTRRPIRYDLNGLPLPPSEDSDDDHHHHAHTHGHHHPTSSNPTQTLIDLCDLTRSSVAAQRSSALDTLTKIIKRLRNSRNSPAQKIEQNGQNERNTQNGAIVQENLPMVRVRALCAAVAVIVGKSPGGAGAGVNVGVTVRAVELLKECIVGWEGEQWEGGIEMGWVEMKGKGRNGPENVENNLALLSGDEDEEDEDLYGFTTDKLSIYASDPLSSIPLPFLLARIELFLTSPSSIQDADDHVLPMNSRSHLLAILNTLAQYSHEAAHEIISTGALLKAVLDTFVATPIPIASYGNSSSNEGMDVDPNQDNEQTQSQLKQQTLPDPQALKLLSTLAASARDNARALVDAGVPDLLLRFIVVIVGIGPTSSSRTTGNAVPEIIPDLKPNSSPTPLSSSNVTALAPFDASPYDPELSLSLITGTLEFYAVLARYGMYARIATDAVGVWSRLGVYVSECTQNWTGACGFRELSGRERDAMSEIGGDMSIGDAQVSSNRSDTTRTSPNKSTPIAQHQSSHTEPWQKLTIAYLRLIQGWLVCARDPHATSPPHEILWSQVEGWAWGEELLSIFDRVAPVLTEFAVGSGPGVFGVWSALLDALGAWLEGSRVNEVKGGEKAREKAGAVVGKGGVVLSVVRHATERIIELVKALEHEPAGNEAWKEVTALSRCLDSATRLCVACLPSGMREGDLGASDDRTGWMKPIYVTLVATVQGLLRHDVIKSTTLDKDVSAARRIALLRPISTFLAAFTRLFHRIVHLFGSGPALSSAQQWIALSTAILQHLLPGDEDDAIWILEELIKAWSSLPSPFPDHGFNSSCLILFLVHAVRPKTDVRLAPLSPTPMSITGATSMTLPVIRPSASAEMWKSEFGLPLAQDWPSVALDHILRSGSSPVLEALPASWNISEVEIVRATLSLVVQMRKAADCAESGLNKELDLRRFSMGAEETIFACMKVFMLEHEQQEEGDSSEEVYRDVQVGNLMEEAVRPFTYASRSSIGSKPPTGSLEAVSARYLGTSAPFFQFYTDFVALYDAVSFSHRLFARLLLVPTGMTYALDYRKHLWGDFGHLLRSISTPIDDVLTHDLKSFIWPFETDGQMIGWYLRALVKSSLEGFPRLVAVHHVACNIWADLQEEGLLREKRAKMLLLAVVGQCKFDVVRDVMRYKQTPKSDDGEIKIPPACYPRVGAWKDARLACVAEWGGIEMKRSLERIFASDD